MPLAPSELVYSNETAAKLVTHHMTAAAFYGWGRVDERPQRVNINEFRAHHGRLARNYIERKSTYLPSVQESWRHFTTYHGPAY